VAVVKDRAAIVKGREAFGKDRAAGGKDRVAVGKDRAAVSTDRAAVGEDRAAGGKDRAAVGKGRVAVGKDRAAVGKHRAAVSTDRAAVCEERAAVCTDRAAAANHGAASTKRIPCLYGTLHEADARNRRYVYLHNRNPPNHPRKALRRVFRAEIASNGCNPQANYAGQPRSEIGEPERFWGGGQVRTSPPSQKAVRVVIYVSVCFLYEV